MNYAKGIGLSKLRGGDPEVRFWKKVDIRGDDDCWNFTGPIKSTGRGLFSVRQKLIQAHRFAYESKVGEIPDGICVLHKCDNGKCCNPNHLFLGTIKDNVADMISKGRKVTLRGEDDPKHKLKELEVFEIVRLYKTGKVSQFKIADMFRVKRTTIQAILQGRNWSKSTGLCYDTIR